MKLRMDKNWEERQKDHFIQEDEDVTNNPVGMQEVKETGPAGRKEGSEAS